MARDQGCMGVETKSFWFNLYNRFIGMATSLHFFATGKLLFFLFVYSFQLTCSIDDLHKLNTPIVESYHRTAFIEMMAWSSWMLNNLTAVNSYSNSSFGRKRLSIINKALLEKNIKKRKARQDND